MHTPTKAQVQVVIDTLTKANLMAPNVSDLDMDSIEAQCGSPACHGGHYLIAKGVETPGLTYSYGANEMSKDLGFPSYENTLTMGTDLTRWANANPYLWGNDDGLIMFSSKYAFLSETRPNGARNLQDIIDHWTEVQTRLPE